VRISQDQKKENPIMPTFKQVPAPKPKPASPKPRPQEQSLGRHQPKPASPKPRPQEQSLGRHQPKPASPKPRPQEQSLGRHQPKPASPKPNAPGMDQTDIAMDPLPPLPYKSELQRQIFVQQEAESGLTTFFESVKSRSSESNPDPLINWSNKTLAPALLSAALKPIIRVVEAATYDASAIYKKLKLINPSLQEDTVNKLVKLLKELSQGKPLDEEALRIAIWELLSDKQANEDLKQVFIGLKQTIQEAQAKTRIDIRGNVYGLIIGDHNVVHQTFNGFLQDKP
jgi:hypothetical protein